ncbi:MAG: FapA family protein [Proteobacteria bacterium]|nr:FapA family protein [Pseudomonadota bacterium]
MIPEQYEGRAVQCKKCGAEFLIRFDAKPGTRPPTGQSPGKNVRQVDRLMLLGRLAVRIGFIAQNAFESALSRYPRTSEGIDPETEARDFFLTDGLITENQYNYLLSVRELSETQALDVLFGQMAVRLGMVEQTDVDRALAEQKRIFSQTQAVALIGDILVNLGLITAPQRDGILETQKRIKNAAPAPPPPKEAQDTGGEFGLTVSGDHIEAHIYPKVPKPEKTTVSDIKSMLKYAGVVFGLIEDEVIEHYLSSDPFPEAPLLVAEGQPSAPGRDPGIKYYFETDPFRIGALKEGGGIDFRERGQIPQVKAEDLIAERLPGTSGTSGTDVYGKSIPAPKPKSVALRCGQGASRSEDGTKAYARIDGRPEISADGRLFVHPNLNIAHDVGIETGHVDFSGHIEVGGSVQDGYRVKGGSLQANEILGARIDIEGDVIVFGGIIGGRIKAGGNVRARFIHEANIQTYGDVVAEKEIFHSHIETSGVCIVERGKIIDSDITAKKGIEAVEVGSDGSSPNRLTVGVDIRIQKEIEVFKVRIAQHDAKRKRLLEIMNDYQPQLDKLEARLKELTEAAETARGKQETLRQTAEFLAVQNDGAQLEKVEGALEYMNSSVAETDGEIRRLGEKLDPYREKMEGYRGEAEALAQAIEGLNEEIEGLLDWSQSEASVPVLKVRRVIRAGTVIKGPRAGMTVMDDSHDVQITEVKNVDVKPARWEMSMIFRK